MKGMLSLLTISLALLAASCSTPSGAQQAEGSTLKSMLEAKSFVFQAQQAQPSRGTSRQLTGGYELRVAGDTLAAQLPYFGRAYQAPMDMKGGGIEFTSTDYGYTLETKRKGRWHITLEPKDAKDVREMILSVSENGYASLQVLSNNREPITFSGVVVERENRR